VLQDIKITALGNLNKMESSATIFGKHNREYLQIGNKELFNINYLIQLSYVQKNIQT
jgi:hypothetical protein